MLVFSQGNYVLGQASKLVFSASALMMIS